MTIPSFDVVQTSLERAGALSDAAECHGTLCGVLCAGPGNAINEWRACVMGEQDADNTLAAEGTALLILLEEETRAALVSPEFPFAPLLPDDSRPLQQRVSALGLWCQGFLFGLSLARSGKVSGLPNEAGEVIQDMTEIARADFDADHASDQDETAYAELVEYIRVGVVLVYEELHNNGSQILPPSPGLH